MAKKDDVLKAAITCFTTYGYSKTTMNDIGKKVGMNKASLYYHFKDKLALYEAVVHSIRIKHMDQVMDKINKQALCTEKIISFVQAEIDFWSNIAINYLMVTSENDESKEETKPVLEGILRNDIRIIKGFIDEGVANQTYSACNAEHIAAHILRVSQGLLLVNCPLNLPKEDRIAGYNHVKIQSAEIITLLLKGLNP